MSAIDVRKLFSYTIATSSISYIKNYNFNSNTVSTIPLSMANSSEELSLTVNITTTYPWVSVVDPATGTNKKYPQGNIVLGPTSSSVVFVKIDLPPELESQPNREINDLYISLDIKSGSFPIITTGQTQTQTGLKNIIVVENDIYYINVGERVPVNITVYDVNGDQDLSALVEWNSNNMSIVQVEEPQNTEVDYTPYSPRYIRGISPGTTTVNIITQDSSDRSASIRVTVRDTAITPTSNTGGGGGISDDQQRNDGQNQI